MSEFVYDQEFWTTTSWTVDTMELRVWPLFRVSFPCHFWSEFCDTAHLQNSYATQIFVFVFLQNNSLMGKAKGSPKRGQRSQVGAAVLALGTAGRDVNHHLWWDKARHARLSLPCYRSAPGTEGQSPGVLLVQVWPLRSLTAKSVPLGKGCRVILHRCSQWGGSAYPLPLLMHPPCRGMGLTQAAMGKLQGALAKGAI